MDARPSAFITGPHRRTLLRWHVTYRVGPFNLECFNFALTETGIRRKVDRKLRRLEAATRDRTTVVRLDD